MVMNASATVTAQTIIDLLEKLSGRLNRDKNAICGGLSLTNQTIFNWYNSLNERFSVEIANSFVNEGSKRTSEEINFLLSYIYKAEYAPTARRCIEFLRDIERRYNSGELRRLVNQMDTNKLFNIYETLVPRFIDHAIQGKTDYFGLEKLKQDRGGFEEAETIKRWLTDLDNLREEIRSSISQLQLTIECPNFISS
jgi:hypothetical protein